MAMRTAFYSWLIVLCFARAASGQTALNLNRMSAPDVAGDVGDSVTVSVQFDNTAPVQGWTVVVCHDSQHAALEEVRLGDDVLALRPDFVNTDLRDGSFRVGVILSLEAQDRPLLPGRARNAHEAVYRLVGNGGVSSLEFCTLSTGPAQVFENVFVIAGRSVGVDEGLILKDGSITVSAVECPRNFICQPDQITKTVALSWEAPTSNKLAGYELRRNGAVVATRLSPDTTSFIDLAVGGLAIRNTALNYTLIPLFADGESPCAPLRCNVSLSASDNVAFADGLTYDDDDQLRAAGFQVTSVNGADPNSSWTVTNPGGSPNPSGVDGRPTDGPFLISDFRFSRFKNVLGSGAAHELRTPPFDCRDKSVVWLHFDAVATLSASGTGVFDVDVSVDNGANWANVFRRVSAGRSDPAFPPVAGLGNTGGVVGRVDVDLTEIAANQRRVHIRFRHFEPTASQIAVDNIVVDDDPPPHVRIPRIARGIHAIVPEPSAQLLINTVDFAPPVGIPDTDDWAVISFVGNSGVKTWTAEDPGLRSALNAGQGTGYQGGNGLYNLDSFFSIMDSLNAGNLEEDEYMITKPVDCSDLGSVYLVFDEEILWFDVRQEILLSLDGGNTFECEPIISYAGDLENVGVCDPNPSLLQEFEKYTNLERAIQIPLAAGEESVAFAFHYESEGEEGWWAVDNVTLYGFPRRFLRGDVDCNGEVNISDPIALLAFLFGGGPAPCCRAAADASGAGTLNLASGVYTLSFLFGGGEAPPAPYPTCGVPEERGLDCAAYPPCEP